MRGLPLEQPGRVWLGCKGPSPCVPPPPRPAPPPPAACLGSDPSSLPALVSQPAARAGLGQLCPVRAHPRAFAPWLSLPGRWENLPTSRSSREGPLSSFRTVPSQPPWHCPVTVLYFSKAPVYLCRVICCPSPQWNVSSQESGSLRLWTHSVQLSAWPTVGSR